jgi:hypothetical protein
MRHQFFDFPGGEYSMLRSPGAQNLDIAPPKILLSFLERGDHTRIRIFVCLGGGDDGFFALPINAAVTNRKAVDFPVSAITVRNPVRSIR